MTKIKTPAAELVGFSASTAKRRKAAFNKAAEAEAAKAAAKAPKKTPATMLKEVIAAKPKPALKKQLVLDAIKAGATVKSMCASLALGETAVRSLIGDLRMAGISIACDRKHADGPFYTLV